MAGAYNLSDFRLSEARRFRALFAESISTFTARVLINQQASVKVFSVGAASGILTMCAAISALAISFSAAAALARWAGRPGNTAPAGSISAIPLSAPPCPGDIPAHNILEVIIVCRRTRQTLNSKNP